jgi:hypothetical protein
MAETILLILSFPIWGFLCLIAILLGLYFAMIVFGIFAYIFMLILGCFLYIIAGIAKGVRTVWRKIFKNVR